VAKFFNQYYSVVLSVELNSEDAYCLGVIG